MTDEQLLIGFAESGSQEMFAELYRRLFMKVVNFLVKRRGVRVERAYDVAQDAFMAVLSRASQFRAESTARTWIIAIARNRNVDILRRRDDRIEVQPSDEGVNLFGYIIDKHLDPSDEVAELEERNNLANNINDRLGSIHAEVIRLLDIEGVDYEDAAIELGIPVGTVRSRRHRALYRLRQLMVAVVLLALALSSPLGGQL